MAVFVPFRRLLRWGLQWSVYPSVFEAPRTQFNKDGLWVSSGSLNPVLGAGHVPGPPSMSLLELDVFRALFPSPKSGGPKELLLVWGIYLLLLLYSKFTLTSLKNNRKPTACNQK